MPEELEAVQARIDMEGGRRLLPTIENTQSFKDDHREMTVGGSTEGYRIGDWEYKKAKD